MLFCIIFAICMLTALLFFSLLARISSDASILAIIPYIKKSKMLVISTFSIFVIISFFVAKEGSILIAKELEDNPATQVASVLIAFISFVLAFFSYADVLSRG